MSIFTAARDLAANTALAQCLPLLNPLVRRYGTIHALTLDNGALCMDIQLLGLERHFNIRAGRVEVSPAGDSITLGDFSADAPFLENALNDFLTGPIPVKGGPGVQLAVKALAGVCA